MLQICKMIFLAFTFLLLVSCTSKDVSLVFTVLKGDDGGISYANCKRGLKCEGGGWITISKDSANHVFIVRAYSERVYIYLDGDVDVSLKMSVEKKDCGTFILKYAQGTPIADSTQRYFIVECK